MKIAQLFAAEQIFW